MLGPDSVRDLQGVEFRLEHPDAHAAAALNGETKASSGEFLIVSPYPTQPHLLDLKPLNESQRLLAKALQILEPTRNDYATAPYAAAFNWASVTAELRNLAESMQYDWKTQYFYIVVFRSQIPPTTNRVELGELDQRSHAEATKSGGLLKYWFGQPDENGRNLATCVWRRQEDARPASVGPGHKAAMRATISMYSEWTIERLRFEIGNGIQEWSIGQWAD